MPDLLDRVIREIRERKEAARAAVEETQRLQAALAALDGQRVSPKQSGRRANGRREAPRSRAPRGANRAALLDVIARQPGVSAAEAARVTGVSRATAASTLARLVNETSLSESSCPRTVADTGVPT